MRLVKTDLRGLNSLGVYLKARIVYGCLNGNPDFPSPTPSMATFNASIMDLQKAISDATDNGRLAHLLKAEATTKVADQIKALGNYVAAVAQGNEVKVVQAGFEMRDRSTRIKHLATPKDLQAKGHALPGRVTLRWAPVHGARVYEVYTAVPQPNAEAEWTLLQVSSGSRCVITGLRSCAYHSFSVLAIGVAGKSALSQPARALVA